VGDATAEWTRLDVIGPAASPTMVEITTAGGGTIDFKPASGGGYTAPEGYEDLILSGSFTLKDLDGNVTSFGQPGALSGTKTYVPVTVREAPGAGSETQLTWEVVNGVPHLKQELAAAPGTANCADLTASAARGCRALTFDYTTSTTATATTPGDYNGRLAQVNLVAWDPASGAMSNTPVAQYQYTVDGRLAVAWDPRISPALKEQYSYDSNGELTGITPAGEAKWTLGYAQPTKQPTDPDFYSDPNAGRLQNASRPTSAGTATETVVYNVPTSGTNAPYDLGPDDVASWAQGGAPLSATAIFPPDQVPAASPPTNWSRATVYYLDQLGREVNHAEPGGRIDMTQYDDHGNVARQLTPENRARILNGSANAGQLDTELTYNTGGPAPAGTEPVDVVGPLHTVKLSTGETVAARNHTHTTYDEGAPADGVYALPTTSTTSAQIAGRPDADVRTTKLGYSSASQGNIGWTIRQPTSVTADPAGLNLTTTMLYDATTGEVTEKRLPANPNGGDAHAKQTIYYAEGTASDPACGSHPEWAGLVCKRKPTGQPGTTGLPNLATKTYTYNRLNLELTETETVATGTTRTTTSTYDAAGRPVSTAVSATEAASVPTVTTGYDAASGRLATTTAQTQGGALSVITRQYDGLGRVTSYTDADGNVSTKTYDIDGRVITENDGKATRTYSYDPVTGDPTQVADSGAGTITGTYDKDGHLRTQTLPGGLQEQTTYDESGQPTRIAYTKTTNCSSNCTWLDSSGLRTPDDQWASTSGTLSSRTYSYDRAGRLTEARATPAGGACVVRSYSYDADSNRTLSVSHPAAADGSCAPGNTGTSSPHSYDAADRLIDSNITYDGFGRETMVSSSANGGKGSLSLTYYANDLTQSATQGGVTRSFGIDPDARQRSVQTVGGDGQSRTLHYSDDSDAPSWLTESTDGLQWTRSVMGLDGDLIATQSETGTRLLLKNVHGDITADASTSSTATALTKTYEADEFGNPETASTTRFGWLGAKERRQEFATSGVISMGVRTYVPGMGRFTAPDPVEGGSANDYDYAGQDPVSSLDLDGRARIPSIPPGMNCEFTPGHPTRGVVHRRTIYGTAIQNCRHGSTAAQYLTACIGIHGHDGVDHAWDCGTARKGGGGVIKVWLHMPCRGGRHTYFMQAYGGVTLTGNRGSFVSPLRRSVRFFRCRRRR
jgi:RHS repeat-associated protein